MPKKEGELKARFEDWTEDEIYGRRTYTREHGPVLHPFPPPLPGFVEQYVGWTPKVYSRTGWLSNVPTKGLGTGLVETWSLVKGLLDRKPPKVIEIGVMFGGSTIFLLDAYQRSGVGSKGGLTSIDIAEESMVELDLLLKEVPGLDRDLLQAHRVDSTEYLKGSDEPIDFLFWDGDHTPKVVEREFVLAYNRLAVGGMIFMHDVGSYRWGRMVTGPALCFNKWDRALGENAEIGCIDSTEHLSDLGIEFPMPPVENDTTRELRLGALIEGGYGMGVVRKIKPQNLFFL